MSHRTVHDKLRTPKCPGALTFGRVSLWLIGVAWLCMGNAGVFRADTSIRRMATPILGPYRSEQLLARIVMIDCSGSREQESAASGLSDALGLQYSIVVSRSLHGWVTGTCQSFTVRLTPLEQTGLRSQACDDAALEHMKTRYPQVLPWPSLRQAGNVYQCSEVHYSGIRDLAIALTVVACLWIVWKDIRTLQLWLRLRYRYHEYQRSIRCRRCGYSIENLEGIRCPECGEQNSSD